MTTEAEIETEPAWCAPARDRIDEANAARRELLQAVCDLAVKVDAIWPDRELDRERSFAYLVMQEFG